MQVADRKLLFDIFARDRNTKRTLEGIAEAADDAGKSFDDMGKDSQHLDRRISETQTHLRGLIDEFDRTGDVEIFKKVRKDRSTLNLLTSMRKELGEVADAAGDAGKHGLRAFMDAFGALPAQVKGVGIAAGAALAASAVPAIGAVLAAGVIGGAGAGGIIGGVVAASRDSRVQSAGSEFGQRFMAGFEGAGQVFVGPLLDSLEVFQDAIDPLMADLRAGFASIAPVLTPLARGIAGLARNIMPGFLDALEVAKPLLRALGNEMPKLGAAISDFFSKISEQGDGAILGLTALLHGLESAIRFAGDAISFLSALFEDAVRVIASSSGALEDLVGWVPILGDRMRFANDKTEEMLATLAKSKDASGDAQTGFSGFTGAVATAGSSAATSAGQIKTLTERLREAAETSLGAFDAHTRFEQAIDSATAAAKANGKTLDVNTEKGRANRDALSGLAAATLAARDKTIELKGSQGEANAIMQRGYDKFVQAARGMGLSKKEAIALARSLGLIPPAKSVTVTIKQTGKKISTIQHEIDSLTGKTITVKVVKVAGGGRITERAEGGPVKKGQPYIVGERGPELVTFDRSGMVHTSAQTKAILSGGAPAAAMAATGPSPLVLNYSGGGSALDDLFISWLHKAIREGKIRMRAGSTAVSVA